jgi:hypothetical protein
MSDTLPYRSCALVAQHVPSRSDGLQPGPPQPVDVRRCVVTAYQLNDILCRERPAAEATLGRRLIDPYAFATDCLTEGASVLRSTLSRTASTNWISTMRCNQ